MKPVCAVIGVGPGNGAAISRRFSEGGCRVALLARSKEFTSARRASSSFIALLLHFPNYNNGGNDPIRFQWRKRPDSLFKRKDGKTLHLRKATRPEPHQLEIYSSLGISPQPGQIQKAVMELSSPSRQKSNL